MTTLPAHYYNTICLDFLGTLINILVLPGGLYVFLFLLAQRLDGKNELSLYMLMTPVWIVALPFFVYIILHGMAAKNERLNMAERFALSFVVPGKFYSLLTVLVGFITSFGALVWYGE